MQKTKIDWCDSTINCVYGCPNNCEYCYGNVMNKRFHFCKDWKIPEWKPDHLKEFYRKNPKSIFIDSMSDIGTWKQEWFDEVIKAIKDNPQHTYIALTKKIDRFWSLVRHCNQGFAPRLWYGTSITTQAQADSVMNLKEAVDFYSIEPILEPIVLPWYLFPKTIIIGAETGNRKDKVIPQKEWIDNLVKQADINGSIVFMKGSLKTIMGNDFRQDTLPWQQKIKK